MSVAKKRKPTSSLRKTIEIEEWSVVDEDDYRAVCQVVYQVLTGMGEDMPTGSMIEELLKVDEEHRVCKFTLPQGLSYDGGGRVLHASIGQLEKLSHLDMRYNLFDSVPTSIGQLKNLSYLNLWIHEPPPDSFGQLESLLNLTLAVDYCDTIPPSVWKLKNLKRLELFGMVGLESLPDEIGDLVNLNTLYLHLKEVTWLPHSIGQLQNLTCLYLLGDLATLPDEIGDLVNLKYLHLSELNSLVSLPPSIGKLKNLQRLELQDCEKLATLPDEFWNLVNLKSLELNCPDIPVLAESVGRMTGLMQLEIGHENQTKSLLTLTKSCHVLGSLCINNRERHHEKSFQKYFETLAYELYIPLACNRARFRFGISHKGTTIQISPKKWPRALCIAKTAFEKYRNDEIPTFGDHDHFYWDWGPPYWYRNVYHLFKDEDAIYQLLCMARGSFIEAIMNRQKNAIAWQDGQTS